MSLRNAARRGITVAVHSDVAILHAAAATEFQSHIQRLVDAGKREEALELWQSVVEVVHFPPPPGNVLQASGLPPMLQIGCADPTCRRCLEQRGGFRFPCLGVWTRRGTLVRTGASPADAWREHAQSEGTLDLLMVEANASAWRLGDLVPPQWRQVMAALGPGDIPGSASKADAIAVWRNWQMGHECWMDPTVALPTRNEAIGNAKFQAQRTLTYWFDAFVEATPYMLAPPCLRCGTPSRRVCAGCFKPQCYECFWTGDQRDCCDEVADEETSFFNVPAMRPGQTRRDLLRFLFRDMGTERAGRRPRMDADASA